MAPQAESRTAEYLRDLVTEINKMRAGNHRKTVEEYILINGRLFASTPLEADAAQVLQKTHWKYHRPRECYMNAVVKMVDIGPGTDIYISEDADDTTPPPQQLKTAPPWNLTRERRSGP